MSFSEIKLKFVRFSLLQRWLVINALLFYDFNEWMNNAIKDNFVDLWTLQKSLA